MRMVRHEFCHRSGFFKSESIGIRWIKSQDSDKINATCMYFYNGVMEGASNVHIVLHKTHFGHCTNLGRCYLITEERAVLAGKMSNGVSFGNLMDQTRDNIENIHMTRKYSL